MMPHTKRLLGGKTLLFVALFYSCALSVVFFLPPSELPKVTFSSADKVVHGLVYFILVTLWMAYLYQRNNFQMNTQWIAILFFSILLYGIIIEISQALFTVSRRADIFDLVANVIGSLLGILFFKRIKNYFKV